MRLDILVERYIAIDPETLTRGFHYLELSLGLGNHLLQDLQEELAGFDSYRCIAECNGESRKEKHIRQEGDAYLHLSSSQHKPLQSQALIRQQQSAPY